MKNISIIIFTLLSLTALAQTAPHIRATLVSDTSFFADTPGGFLKVREKTFLLPDGTIQKATDIKKVFSDSASLKEAQNDYKKKIAEKQEQIKRLQDDIKKIEDEAKFVDGEFDKKKKGGKKDAPAPVDTQKINLNPVSKPAPDVKINLETATKPPKSKTKKKTRKKQ